MIENNKLKDKMKAGVKRRFKKYPRTSKPVEATRQGWKDYTVRNKF